LLSQGLTIIQQLSGRVPKKYNYEILALSNESEVIVFLKKKVPAREVEPADRAKKSPFIRGLELVPAPRIERGTY
jgi:hypothetical protein